MTSQSFVDKIVVVKKKILSFLCGETYAPCSFGGMLCSSRAEGEAA